MKNTIERHQLTDKQIAACKGIKKAFEKARKLGLSFLAKQDAICAYHSKSLEHAVPLHQHFYGETIPYYSIQGCISDSGADDEEHFPKGFIEY